MKSENMVATIDLLFFGEANVSLCTSVSSAHLDPTVAVRPQEVLALPGYGAPGPLEQVDDGGPPSTVGVVLGGHSQHQ